MTKVRALPSLTQWGIHKTFHPHPDGSFTVKTSQDAEPIIERNKADQNLGNNGYTKSRNMQKVASIPMTVQLKWRIEEGIDIYNPDHALAVARKLNDPEWRHLRCGLGQLQTKGLG